MYKTLHSMLKVRHMNRMNEWKMSDFDGQVANYGKVHTGNTLNQGKEVSVEPELQIIFDIFLPPYRVQALFSLIA